MYRNRKCLMACVTEHKTADECTCTTSCLAHVPRTWRSSFSPRFCQLHFPVEPLVQCLLWQTGSVFKPSVSVSQLFVACIGPRRSAQYRGSCGSDGKCGRRQVYAAGGTDAGPARQRTRPSPSQHVQAPARSAVGKDFVNLSRDPGIRLTGQWYCGQSEGVTFAWLMETLPSVFIIQELRIISSQMVVMLPALCTGHALLPRNIMFLVIISVRGLSKLQGLVWPEGLG
jgi:hypothetical protein